MEETKETNVNEKKQSMPKKVIIIFFLIYFIISLISSFLFLKYFVDMKKISKIIFSICYIYFTLFLFFQLMTMFDLIIPFLKDNVYSDQIDFIISIITNFYFYFNCLGLFLRFVFFPVYSGFLESGYIKTWKKLLDAFFYHYIIVSIVGIIFLIIYTDEIIGFYGDYGSLILNSLNFVTLVEVYMHVGFFIIQNIIDCRRKCNKNVNNRYYTDFQNLVTKKMNKDIDKMNKTYKELSKQNLEMFEPDYFQKISLLLNKAKENNEIYKINVDLVVDKDKSINEGRKRR